LRGGGEGERENFGILYNVTIPKISCRCNNVLYIRGVPEEDDGDEKMGD
jgi:hypothetical protein